MYSKNRVTFMCFLTVFLFVIACHKTSSDAPQLNVSLVEAVFAPSGGTLNTTITSNAQWNISNPASAWLQIIQPSGNSGTTTVQLTAASNATGAARTAVLEVSASNGQVKRISVSQAAQAAGMYPSYNTNPLAPDSTGMSGTAVQLAANIKLGINIGNTLEATGSETAWGNQPVTQALIDLIKRNGFNAIRIPCAWDSHCDSKATAHISTDWMNRVKQVVQYCINDSMYVLLNIHWDGGWLEQNCTTAKKDSVNAKQKAYWEQIATAMRDFDKHLMFASANEPNASDATGIGVLWSYHQTFVDAVRSTGGKNSYRTLVVQSPSTSIDLANQYITAMPSDPSPNKVMLEVHYYTPPTFCILSQDASWGRMAYYWGQNYHSTTDPTRNATFAEEPYVDSILATVKKNFVNKGIPVIMGEFGAVRHSELTGSALTLSLASRAHFYRYVTQQAKANGLLPFLWDTGYTQGGIFDRPDYTIFDQQCLDSLRVGAGL